MSNLTLHCNVRGKYKKFSSVNDTDVEGGIECYFVALTNGYGMKIFRLRHLAFASIKRQRLAAKHNVGPRVFSSLFHVDSIEDNGVTWNIERAYKCKTGWAYLTQIAKVDHKYIGSSRLERLSKALRKLGISEGGDLRPSNIGTIGKKTVLIDFGNVTCTCP